MKKNIFEKWEPISNLPGQIYLEGLHDDYEGFRLMLKGLGDQASMLRVKFSPALVYRIIDEGDLLSFEITETNPKIGEWCFFTVNNSDFLFWFNQVSQGIHQNRNPIHYAIYTPNECIDIVSTIVPTVEWL